MDMIDRVAAAILAMPAFPDAYGAQHWEEDRPVTLAEWLDGTHIHDSVPDLMRRAAIAAIEAMRNPTEKVLKAFYGEIGNTAGLDRDWNDMIDAALGEPE